jgi:peptidoglycan hydrolase CwlO-like protein
MYPSLSNQQLYDKNNEKINAQDDYLDDILVNVGDIQNNANQINSEIERQDGLIDTLTGKTDSNVEGMKKTANKLDGILKSQSYCKLYIIILVEVFILFAIMFI